MLMEIFHLVAPCQKFEDGMRRLTIVASSRAGSESYQVPPTRGVRKIHLVKASEKLLRPGDAIFVSSGVLP